MGVKNFMRRGFSLAFSVADAKDGSVPTLREKPRRKRSAMSALLPREKIFVREWCRTYNGTRSAITAGYSEKSAHVTASRMIRKAKIIAAVAEWGDKHGVTEVRTTAEIAEIAYHADIADFQPWLRGEMSLVELRESGVDTRLVKTARITEVYGDGGNVIREIRVLELHDRTWALGLLDKAHQIVRVQVSATLSPGDALKSMPTGELLRRAEAIAPVEGFKLE